MEHYPLSDRDYRVAWIQAVGIMLLGVLLGAGVMYLACAGGLV